MTRVPLRASGLARRKPWLDVGGGKVTFVLPSWFGDHTFSTPAANVVVGEASHAALALPYLDTHGPTPANLALVFREPVPVPPLADDDRELPPEVRREGYLDGMRLLATDPRAAAEALAAAGAHRVVDLGAWFGEHRPDLADDAAVILPPHPAEPWLERVGGALALVGVLAALGGKVFESIALSFASLVPGLTGAFLLTWAPRLLRRRAAARRRPPGAGPGG